jgi:hypothetical protein
MNNFNFNLELFNSIAEIMKKYIYKYNYANENPTLAKYINICCEQEQIDFLQPILNILQENNPKPEGYSDYYYQSIMYFLILYLYYSLVLGEQSDDLLDTKILSYIIYRFWGNYEESKTIYNVIFKLYIDITTSDITYCSQIRRMFFGMDVNVNVNVI